VLHARRLAPVARNKSLVRWLWFLAAYLFVIVFVLWLAGILPAPISPPIGWAE
jgi:hypothetical protein